MAQATTPPPFDIVFFDGDWGALVAPDGTILEEGHHDDLQRHALERLGIETVEATVPFREASNGQRNFRLGGVTSLEGMY